MCRPGCCFAHLQSAVQFIMTVDASMLNLEDKEDFTRRLALHESQEEEGAREGTGTAPN